MATPEQQEILDALLESAPDLVDLMPDRCTIQGPTQTQVKGDRVQGWGDLATEVNCRVTAPRTGTAEYGIAVGMGLRQAYVVVMPLDTVVTVEHRIVMHDGRILDVKAVPLTTYRVQVRAICEQVVA